MKKVQLDEEEKQEIENFIQNIRISSKCFQAQEELNLQVLKKQLKSTLTKNYHSIQKKGRKEQKFFFDRPFFNYFILEHCKSSQSNKVEKAYYNAFKELKRKNFIHKDSVFFPKNLSLVSVNPNDEGLYLEDYSDIDLFASRIDEFKNLLQQKDTPNLELHLYKYLKYYHIVQVPLLEELRFKDIIILEDNKALAYIMDKDTKKTFKMYRIYLLDKLVSKVLALLKSKNIDNPEQPIFDKSIIEQTSEEDRLLNKFGIRYMQKVKRAYYLFSSKTPLEFALNTQKIPSAALTLSEIEKLYPGSISKQLLDEEREFIEKLTKQERIQKTYNTKSEYLIRDVLLLDQFLKSKKGKYTKRELEAIQKDIGAHIKADKSTNLPLEWVKDILSREGLAPSTKRNYILALNKHLFRVIEDFQAITADEVSQIINDLSSESLSAAHVNTVFRQMNDFFDFAKIGFSIDIRARLVSYPKSLIFYDEIDKILLKIEESFLEAFKGKNRGKNLKFAILQWKVLVLICFYTGLRRSELQSRLIQDIEVIEDMLFVNVNSKGMTKLRKKFKSSNARRRVEAKIANKTHLGLIREFIRIREAKAKSTKPFFVLIKGDYKATSYFIADEVFDKITSIIKDVTKRYTSFHSLRHSFASYWLLERYQNSDMHTFSLFELSMQLGHSTPEVSIKKYIHWDVMRLATL